MLSQIASCRLLDLGRFERRSKSACELNHKAWTMSQQLSSYYKHKTRNAISLPTCPKRASVALVIRVRPSFPDRGGPLGATSPVSASTQEKLATFVQQPWVRRGEPEILFIKRATRKGDRWTGDIALPGGKREREDESDRACCVRETAEEVGVDLEASYALHVGDLPQRMVTTWSSSPLMVLCAFVYVLTQPDIPPFESLNQTRSTPLTGYPSGLCLLENIRSTSIRTWLADCLDFAVHWPRGLLDISSVRLCFRQYISCRRKVTTASKVMSRRMDTLFKLRRAPPSGINSRHCFYGVSHTVSSPTLLHCCPAIAQRLSGPGPTLSPVDFRLLIWIYSYWFRKENIRLFTWKPGTSQARAEGTRLPEFDVNGARLELSAVNRLDHTQQDQIGRMLVRYYKIMKWAVVSALLMRASFVSFAIMAIRHTFIGLLPGS